MKPIFALVVGMLIISSGASAQNFKLDFYKAHVFIDYEMYELALPAFIKLNKNYPGNSNVQAIIGYLYLQTPHQKEKSLQFLQLSQANLTAYYKFRNHKEDCAPIQSVWFLGKAYYENQLYDKAIEKFSEYKEALRKGNKKDIKAINQDIKLSLNAKQRRSNSI